jgi:hypothetical protein
LVIGLQSGGDVAKHVSEIRAGLETCLRFEDKVLDPMTSLLKRLLAAYPMREFSYAPGQVATLHSEPSPVINNFYGAVTTYIREKIEACVKPVFQTRMDAIWCAIWTDCTAC